ncbi:hypothetical protein [Burkholderia anthina]|uniref:hypothetical protein n=1 Tax=Burkholderia anthina TaxID=179879 RepID=UPI001AA0A8E6|nr:hypothetical protein [Burkholderia anthina]QTD88795.1 hypothetical protein J4G50_13320 [Burkholderia anthina]
MRIAFFAAAFTLAATSAAAGTLATQNFKKGNVEAQLTITDVRCKGGPAPYNKETLTPVAGTAYILTTGGDKARGCWSAPWPSQEIEVQWSDGAVGRYQMGEFQPTNYGQAHGW